jgi:hypothetical protein
MQTYSKSKTDNGKLASAVCCALHSSSLPSHTAASTASGRQATRQTVLENLSCLQAVYSTRKWTMQCMKRSSKGLDKDAISAWPCVKGLGHFCTDPTQMTQMSQTASCRPKAVLTILMASKAECITLMLTHGSRSLHACMPPCGGMSHATDTLLGPCPDLHIGT